LILRLCRVRLLLLGILIAYLPVHPAVAERVPQVEGVFYYQPAAYGFGAQTLWNNPAGIGCYPASGFQLMADYANDDYPESWGWVVHRHHLAIAYRNLDRDEGEYAEYVFGLGLPVGESGTHFGASYRYFKTGPGIFNKRHFWNVGLLSQSSGSLSWAAVLSNLNRGRVEGERSEIEQRYSVAYRPMDSRLTLAVDMLLSTGTKLSNADYVYHAQFIPTPGLTVHGFIDSDKNFELGFRANLLKYFVGSGSGFTSSGDSRRTTTYVGATSLRQPSLIKQRKRRLVMSFSGGSSENPPQPVFGPKRPAFVELISSIYRAADDPSIGEMVVAVRGLGLGFGQAQELREALRFFRSKSKRVICHLSMPNNIGYYLATVCDSILIPPVSQFNLTGLRAELTFYAGALQKAGIKADIVRVGEYKTAPERYTRSAASEENRRQVNHLLDGLYDRFISDIAAGRGLTGDSVIRIVDNGPFTSAEALEYGLVDGLSYRDEVSDGCASRLPEVSFRRYQADTLISDDWGRKPEIALVVAEGDIAFENSGLLPSAERSATPALLKQAFARAAENPRVKGIVFRINSPGGLALAGEEIFRAAQRAAEKKPVVVSMSNVAASGGYYIAMPATHIFADPTTITGSIGIYGGKLDLSGLYDKLSLGKELYTRGRYAGMLTWSRPFTGEEREKYHSHLRAFYEHFLRLVSENRGLPVDSIDHLSRGRVWTGWEARANGLVDQLGGIQDAIAFTADQCGLDDYRLEIYPKKRPLFLLPAMPFARYLTSIFSDDDSPTETAANALGVAADGEVIARIPFDIKIE
jgi:protease-4